MKKIIIKGEAIHHEPWPQVIIDKLNGSQK
jgi:hypothetical protein